MGERAEEREKRSSGAAGAAERRIGGSADRGGGRDRDRLHQFAQEAMLGLGLGGHVEKCAQAVAFDGVAYAARRFSLQQPRRPGSGDGFNRSDVTKHVGSGIRVRRRLGTRLVAGGGV